jgi:hypothetical protein
MASQSLVKPDFVMLKPVRNQMMCPNSVNYLFSESLFRVIETFVTLHSSREKDRPDQSPGLSAEQREKQFDPVVQRTSWSIVWLLDNLKSIRVETCVNKYSEMKLTIPNQFANDVEIVPRLHTLAMVRQNTTARACGEREDGRRGNHTRKGTDDCHSIQ